VTNCTYRRTREASKKQMQHHQMSSGIEGLLRGILPASMDTADLILLLILLLLYLDSKDEEFLIILAAVAFSMFSGGKL